jgi:HAD superfamily hydrolase (TIGR01509 family)
MSSINPIRFIYFDVGGVLLEFEHSRTQIPQIFGIDKVSYSQVMTNVAHQRNIGKLNGQELEIIFNKEFGKVFPKGYLVTGQSAELFSPIKEMHHFIEKLATRYRLGLLTNVSREVHDRIQRDFANVLYPPVDLEIKITSFEEGVAKPDLEIYRRAIARTKLHAAEILFIDDKLENITAAKQVGMQAMLFETKNPQKMIENLGKLLLS